MNTRCARGGSPRHAVLLFAALALGAFAPAAAADVCSECPAPTMADLKTAPGFVLDRRGMRRAIVETDAGECVVNLLGTPRIRETASWLVLRGSGEVWNCPHSSSTDTITVSASESDSKSWSLSGTVSISGKILGTGLSASITKTVAQQAQITEVTTLSKALQPAWCHRIAWYGYFQVATYVAEADIEVRRKYAWWTKWSSSASQVLRSGILWMSCGSTTATLDAQAPITGYFDLEQKGCEDPECDRVPTVSLGLFGPPPPPPPPGPITPTEEAPPREEKDPVPETTPVPPSSDLPPPPAGIPPSPFDDDEETGS